MKQKKTSNKATILSPENYIRLKSRNLPILKCLISSDWEEAKLCNIFIIRQHANGNITYCMYLVDLACLGVKDTLYFYNLPFENLQRLEDTFEEQNMVFVEISYELAHNIIYAAVDFAEEYGLKPCRDFISITEFFLEEDTDDFPYIEIPCGDVNGKPVYINTGFESPAREKQILAQLAKTAGEGNYNLDEDLEDEDDLFDNDLFDDDDAEEDDAEEDEDEEYRQITETYKLLNLEEQKRLFLEVLQKDEKEQRYAFETVKHIVSLTEILADAYVSEEEIETQVEVLEGKFKDDFVPIDILPNSLFTGISHLDDTKIRILIDDFCTILLDEKKSKKDIEKFRKEKGDVPVTDYFELNHLLLKSKKRYHTKLKECHQKYPDYFLFQLFNATEFGAGDKKAVMQKIESLLLNHQQAITRYEAEVFFYAYTQLVITDYFDLATLMGYEEYIPTLGFICDETFKKMRTMIKVSKIKKVFERIQSEHKKK